MREQQEVVRPRLRPFRSLSFPDVVDGPHQAVGRWWPLRSPFIYIPAPRRGMVTAVQEAQFDKEHERTPQIQVPSFPAGELSPSGFFSSTIFSTTFVVSSVIGGTAKSLFSVHALIFSLIAKRRDASSGRTKSGSSATLTWSHDCQITGCAKPEAAG